MHHLLDEDDATGSSCPVGSTLAPYTSQMFQGPENVSYCRGMDFMVIVAFTDGLQAYLIHLETHEDSLCSQTHLGTPQVLDWKTKGDPLVHYVWSPFLHHGTPWTPPNESISWSFNPLERLISRLLSYLVGLSPKVLSLCTLFYFWGSIRPF